MECKLMVTRFFKVVNNNPADKRFALSDSIHAKIWRASWVCAITLSCGLWTGCQSTRLGSRSDSLTALQSEEAEDELENKSNKGGLTSFFTRWWPTDPKDEAYDLGLPRVEEDYVLSDTDAEEEASGRLSDKPSSSKSNSNKSSTNPAEKRKNQFAKKLSTAPTEEPDGLNPAQRDLYRRQMEAMRQLGLNDGDLGDILADNTDEDGLDGIVQLPPTNSSKTPTAPNRAINNDTLADTGTRLKFSDDSTPPPPPAATQNPLAANPSVPPAPQMNMPLMNAPQQTPALPSPNTSYPINAFANAPEVESSRTPNTVNVVPGTLPNPPASTYATPESRSLEFPSSLPIYKYVQRAGTTDRANEPSGIGNGTYFENSVANSLPNAAPTHWESDVRQAVIKLQDRLTNDKTLTPKERTNLETRLRLMQLAANDLDAAISPNQGWGKDADQWFRSTLFSIHEATALTGPESPNQRFTLVAKHQREAAQHLLSLSDLEVNNVTFCTEVLSYGQVVKRPANALTANEEIILYCEFNNFAALKVHDGYETEFEARFEIVDLQNNRIYEEKLPTDRQTSANRRRDYFIAYQMYLPKDISPGHYRLKLNVKDVKAGKFGQGIVEFQIVK
jgi:hypothetical protein